MKKCDHLTSRDTTTDVTVVTVGVTVGENSVKKILHMFLKTFMVFRLAKLVLIRIFVSFKGYFCEKMTRFKDIGSAMKVIVPYSITVTIESESLFLSSSTPESEL